MTVLTSIACASLAFSFIAFWAHRCGRGTQLPPQLEPSSSANAIMLASQVRGRLLCALYYGDGAPTIVSATGDSKVPPGFSHLATILSFRLRRCPR